MRYLENYAILLAREKAGFPQDPPAGTATTSLAATSPLLWLKFLPNEYPSVPSVVKDRAFFGGSLSGIES
jgi:hypothetical protein